MSYIYAISIAELFYLCDANVRYIIYIHIMRYVRTVEIVTQLAKSLVERVTILDRNVYCRCYENEGNTVDQEFCYVFTTYLPSFNHTEK